MLSFDELESTHGTLKATASHLCINDNYQATYRFYSENRFGLTYVVKGPQKDYISDTIFTREESSSTKVDSKKLDDSPTLSV